eukprot:tig00001253_g7803.t1
MSGEALRLVRDESVGRAYVAARAIRRGELLLEERPLLIVSRAAIDEALALVGWPPPVGYDDEPEEWGAPRDGGRTLAVDVARLRAYLAAPQAIRDVLADLYAPEDPAFPAVRAAAEVARWFKSAFPGECGEAEEAELRRALLVLDANAHDLGDSAAGVFPRSAMFAHSCAPVARFELHTPDDDDDGSPPLLRHWATEDVPPGALVAVSYLGHGVWASRRVRRALLRQDKFFDCRCPRCCDPRDPCRSMPCPACCAPLRRPDGLLDPSRTPHAPLPLVCPVLDERGIETWPCLACGRSFSYPEVRAAARMSEGTEDRIERQVIHFDRAVGSYGGPDSLEALALRRAAVAGRLGPHHWAAVRLRFIEAECLAIAGWLARVAGLDPGPLLADLYARLRR